MRREIALLGAISATPARKMTDASAPPNLSLDASLEALRRGHLARFAEAKTEVALRDENAKILGKKGELTALLKDMGKLSPDERRAVGEKVNVVKREVEEAFEARLHALHKELRDADLNAPPFDLSLPARMPWPAGTTHPLRQVREEVISIFRGMGFGVHDGPEVEREDYNFGKLGFPLDHPATDMQDSFRTTAGHLLRTHTSNVQVRAMLGQKPPFAFIAPGAVYRRDDDATHSPMFHQLEAFMVAKDVSLSHLKGVLQEFVERFYGPGTGIRLRPSYFPFVEPGAEVDIQCVFCKTAAGSNAGCSLCKHTGWIEVLGCGMIHPVVFENCGLDSEMWSGFALGMGIERLAMLRYGVPNIRLFFENDPRFLSQF